MNTFAKTDFFFELGHSAPVLKLHQTPWETSLSRHISKDFEHGDEDEGTAYLLWLYFFARPTPVGRDVLITEIDVKIQIGWNWMWDAWDQRRPDPDDVIEYATEGEFVYCYLDNYLDNVVGMDMSDTLLVATVGGGR